jgi:glycosyltransferase involved in cell wall biosynthesis
MNNISVVLEVYNEENRLENCLKSFLWADEIVVFVKQSTDKTLEIAQKYATHVYEVEYCDASQNVINNFQKHNFKEWCFIITASSIVDDSLIPEITKITSNKSLEIDVIGLPYEIYVFNLTGPYSPWYNEYKYPLIKKKVLKLSTTLHNEISWNSKKVYNINKKINGRFKHYTHINPDLFFTKHLRYVKNEAIDYKKKYNDKAFQKALIRFFRALAFVIFKRRTIFKGKDGFVLSLAYISYYLMLLIYVWFFSRSQSKLNKNEIA